MLIAIEGAAISHELPQPYMNAEDTDETEAPKIAAGLLAAGEKFGIVEALAATGRGIIKSSQSSKERQPSAAYTRSHAGD